MIEKPRCPVCDSGFVYVRSSDKMLICRRCGHQENKKPIKEGVQ